MIACPNCGTPNWFRPDPIQYTEHTTIRFFKCRNCGEYYKYRYPKTTKELVTLS